MSPQQLSFRDPAGRVFRDGQRILRQANAAAATDLLSFEESAVWKKLVQSRRIVGTRRVSDSERDQLFPGSSDTAFEHPAIPFPSYPYEWSPEMLLAAGMATIDLGLNLVDEGLGLKDGSAFNILFDGTRPVFVDVLSIEQRSKGDSRWLPFSQFQRHFVLPLLASKYCGLSLQQSLLSSHDGLEPEGVFRMVGAFRRMMPPFLGLVFLPTVFSQKRRGYKAQLYETKSTASVEQSRYVFSSTLKYLRRQLTSVAPDRKQTSTWSEYMVSNSYSQESFEDKVSFVRGALAKVKPDWVLDVGCNTGHFSRIAAEAGAKVVAIDIDPAVIDSVYREASSRSLEILPLNVNLAQPTPATGWNNGERSSFLDRAHKGFNLVLGLAVLHHMVVTERIPLEDAIGCFADLTRDAAVIEFIDPGDEMFRQIARGRDDLFKDITQERFERACRRHFEIAERKGPLNGTRWLYLLRSKAASA